jgi:hypothetical protein
LYGDGGYELSHLILRPWLGSQLSDAQQKMNADCSAVRVSVEQSFALVTKYFQFFSMKPKMNFKKCPIGFMWIVATLFVNCRSCLYGNQIGDYFNFHVNDNDLNDYLGIV